MGTLLRFEPRWAAARRAIAAGDIGDVLSIATRRVGNVLDQNILRGRTTIPLYYGVHDLDIVRWFAGAEAKTVFALRRYGMLEQLGYPIHDLYYAVFEFENNIVANAELGWHVPPAAVGAPTAGITVVGTKGCVNIDQAETGLSVWTDTGRSAVHPVIDVTFWPEVHSVPGGALANELRHFVHCAQTGSTPIIVCRMRMRRCVCRWPWKLRRNSVRRSPYTSFRNQRVGQSCSEMWSFCPPPPARPICHIHRR
ncbi:MAG: hypothetical protein IPK19_10500 [Chloroflexi bacterium]|nr:hypothetical protein [Chloroflexota bacterium]